MASHAPSIIVAHMDVGKNHYPPSYLPCLPSTKQHSHNLFACTISAPIPSSSRIFLQPPPPPAYPTTNTASLPSCTCSPRTPHPLFHSFLTPISDLSDAQGRISFQKMPSHDTSNPEAILNFVHKHYATFAAGFAIQASGANTHLSLFSQIFCRADGVEGGVCSAGGGSPC